MKNFLQHFIKNITVRSAIAVILGNVIASVGIAILRFSLMGNDPYTASTMAISGGLGVGLGNYQLTLNLVLLIIQLIFGRNYIGFGTVINMCLMGYMVQFSSFVLNHIFHPMTDAMFVLRLLVMVVSLFIISLGLALYQAANLGVAPYDFLALGMTDRFPTPFFLNRVITDGLCVVTILCAVFFGLIDWSGSNLGVGTIICAFGLGPVINLFTPWSRRFVEGKN